MSQSERSYAKALVWFRRDLRVHDHAALSHALGSAAMVHCVFVFDTDILNRLPTRADRRVEFIWHCVRELDRALRARGGGLQVLHGSAREEIPRLAHALGVDLVCANRDYEPEANARDAAVEATLAAAGIAFHTCKDQVVFEAAEILSQAGTPYNVFTPYKHAWLKKFGPEACAPHPLEHNFAHLARVDASEMPSLASLGFAATDLLELGVRPGMSGARDLMRDFLQRIDDYADLRDYPAASGPSRLSVHLRFGTVSIRELTALASARASRGADTWLSELIWREFYFAILAHYPRVACAAFHAEMDALEFENREDYFAAWCAGNTGYPLVDAAMRQLNQTGYMHNRLRMVSASFLVKDLGVDWRWGERYFAERLLDYDLAANNGGWQWSASTGCDAQPYFRIFNPVTQSERFDPKGEFILRYLPQLRQVTPRRIHAPWTMSPQEQQRSACELGRDYPRPLVDHAVAREKTLARYARARSRIGTGRAR